MRNHHRFKPAMLKMLERKRIEQRARERSHQFTRAPECWLRSALGPDARQARPSGDDALIDEPVFRLPSQPEPVRARPCAPLSTRTARAGRAAKHYAALHAEQKELAARTKAKTRRKKATAIDAKRLKLTVERVQRPKPVTTAPTSNLSLCEPTDHWFGPTRHPAFDLVIHGGQ